MMPAQPDAFTIGIEEEYQVIDPVTGALRSEGTAIRNADWTASIIPEMQESTIEIGTRICGSAGEARAQLCAARTRTATVAASEGLGIVAAGLHPFSRWEGHTIPDHQRYRDIVHTFGRIARDEHIFGMHIHVGVPQEHDRVELMNVLRHYLPLMLALSTSSAFFEGEDTGFASYRTIIWRRWPSSGIPPRFASGAAFNEYVAMLLASGTIKDRGNLYWSMRPHPKYPTIEFRITDVCPNVDDAAAIGAVARALTAAVAYGIIRDDAQRRLTSVLEHEMLRVNEWRVARDGLDAELVDAVNGETHHPARVAIRRMLDVITPVARDLGDEDVIAHVHTILERGTGTDRARRIFGQTRSIVEVTQWLHTETLAGIGMDRRSEQRV